MRATYSASGLYEAASSSGVNTPCAHTEGTGSNERTAEDWKRTKAGLMSATTSLPCRHEQGEPLRGQLETRCGGLDRR